MEHFLAKELYLLRLWYEVFPFGLINQFLAENLPQGSIKAPDSKEVVRGGPWPPNILLCPASKVVQVEFVSPDCPNLALKSCFRAQNTPKFEDFFLKSQKKFGRKSLALKTFFWPPQSQNPTYLPVRRHHLFDDN